MEWSLTQNKLLAFHRLMRTDKPIGALLLLWPTLWALWVATPGVPQLWILAVFVAGVWLMRAAGCVVNDYADRKFDGHVKRTANRPLPSGAVTEKEARALFVVLVLISFLLVLTLNTMTILLSIAALALACMPVMLVPSQMCCVLLALLQMALQQPIREIFMPHALLLCSALNAVCFNQQAELPTASVKPALKHL